MAENKKKTEPERSPAKDSGLLSVRGANQNNLRNLSLDIPRDKFVVFTGISGSGKSSLVFETVYAEAQRRYFESLAPYARRLLEQVPAPKVQDILGLPPAVAVQQHRHDSSHRSSVGTVSKLSNSLRMLFSRVGSYPAQAPERLDSDAFSYNTAAGACPSCHGVGVVHSVSEKSLVPNPDLSIREHAIAAWPGAWQGKNLRDILAVLGYDIDKAWKDLPQLERDWILFTDEKPVVTVHAEREAKRIQRPYQGTYMSASSYVLHTFANTKSSTLRKRAASFMESKVCLSCNGKRLQEASLAVKFAGFDIAEISAMPLSSVGQVLAQELEKLNSSMDRPVAKRSATDTRGPADEAAILLLEDLLARIKMISRLGLDYLSMDRSIPSLSSGEAQRLRLAVQLKSGLFGVLYVLDEPSAGLHPSEISALYATLMDLLQAGNSLFVVEHDMSLVSKADWLVDIGPGAGEHGGELLYSGPVAGLARVESSRTRPYLFAESKHSKSGKKRQAKEWLSLKGIKRHNIKNLDLRIPLGVLSAVSGVSGAGKSTLVSKVLFESLKAKLTNAAEAEVLSKAGGSFDPDDNDESEEDSFADGASELIPSETNSLAELEGFEQLDRVIAVDQKPIGRTPRSNLATYTGIFDGIRQIFAGLKEAKERGYKSGRFSFNVAAGRCPQCEGQGFVSVELLFLPSVYSPCSMCQTKRYEKSTLEVRYKGLNIADVLDLTVEQAQEFFQDSRSIARALEILARVGLSYLKLGQPAPELSGGEAQRIKLARELQRPRKGHTVYLLDEPSTGLHPQDLEHLLVILQDIIDAGNTVVVVEHDLDFIARCDWVIDLGPGGGERGGRVVAEGSPEKLAKDAGQAFPESITLRYLQS